jgi:hypothetical protein
MNRTLRWFPQSAGASHRTARDRRPRRPRLEPLENLRLLSLTYHGGPVISHPEVETVYWGQDWSASKGTLAYLQPTQVYGSFPAGDNQRQINEIDNFFTNITNSPYMDLLNQYSGVGRGLFEGHDVSPESTTPPANGATVTDPQIQSMLNGEILAGRVPSPLDQNQLYFVFMPPNVVVYAYGATSTHDFAGYHYLFKDSLGQTVHYAVIPYPGPVLAFGSQTFAASHELAEAATDPELNGWYDSGVGPQHGEIGDLAFPQGGNLNGYSVSSLWSNKDNAVVLPQGYSHTTSHTGYIGSITVLTNVWGYPYIFGIGSDGTVYYQDQDFSGNWSGWNSNGAPSHSLILPLSHQPLITNLYWYGATSISVINDGGAFRVFAIGKDNAVYTYAQGDRS